MKPLFVTSSVESIRYLRGEIVINNPVNISLCKSLEKDKFSWYPDNEGKPSIKFNGCDTQWVYNDEDTRNKDYEALKSNKLIEQAEQAEKAEQFNCDVEILEVTVNSLKKVILDNNVKIAKLLENADC